MEPARRRSGEFGLVTLHRPSNVDDPDRLASLVAGRGVVAHDLPLLWPGHPRARARLNDFGIAISGALRLVEPFGYLEMAGMLDAAAVVVTDSGGLQEESTALGVPCVTLRESTERPITVSEGTNRMVPWPPTAGGIVTSVVLHGRRRGPGAGGASGGVGWWRGGSDRSGPRRRPALTRPVRAPDGLTMEVAALPPLASRASSV